MTWVDTGLNFTAKQYRNTPQTYFKEQLQRHLDALNTTDLMYTAAINLRSTFWFGLLEETDRSYELLANALGYNDTIQLKLENSGDSRKVQNVRKYLLNKGKNVKNISWYLSKIT